MEIDGKNVAQVAALLARSIVTTEEEQTNITKAEEMVRGLIFDQFEENSACQVLRGIRLRNFQTVVERIAKRYDLPDDKKGEILDGEYGEVNEAVNLDFFFNVGKTSDLVFFKVTTVKTEVKNEEAIDLALVSYRLKFKLSAERIEKKRRKWLLGFIPLRTVTSEHYNPRNLSQRDRSGFEIFFRSRALQKFLREYPEARAGLPRLNN
jgi:hypothetical protein